MKMPSEQFLVDKKDQVVIFSLDTYLKVFGNIKNYWKFSDFSQKKKKKGSS